jgi:hypothetical protein
MNIPIHTLIKNCRNHVVNIDTLVVENEHLLAVNAKPSFDDLLSIGADIAKLVDNCLLEVNKQVDQINLEELKQEIGRDGRNIFKKITEVVTVHSHRLRAPISRIEGIMTLQEVDPDMSKDPEEADAFQKEIVKSLSELSTEFDQLERLFCEIEMMLEN